LLVRSMVGLLLVASATVAAAQEMRGSEMRSPKITRALVDWSAATAKLGEIEAPAAAPAALAHLNEASATLFPNIAASPVPVLLPFDAENVLRDRAAGKTEHTAADYMIGFARPPFFQAGPGGYDAAFSIFARDLPDLGLSFSQRIEVQISGSALLYELDEPSGMTGFPANGLETEIPGLRRLFLENVVRYTFVRYGVPYVVAMECFDGGARYRKISCRNADKIAARFLKALQVAGGTPHEPTSAPEPKTIDRPEALSTVFTFHAPGDLLPGTGMKGNGGRGDRTVYSRMRFPIADAPAYANSQSFMNWGDCDQTGRVGMGRRGNAAAYRCRVNGLPLVADESAAGNYSYPWRDNFCEHRYFFVGDCPGGLGHQGQDIRPSSCKQRSVGANRCEPYYHDVVAVRDGIVLRVPGQFSVHVVVNAPDERVRFRYLHMSPKQLDQAGILSGRVVREGEVIGKVGNFFRSERATTYHLHFDLQVPTKYGWVFVNPYMTLVASYERLIRGRGQEIKDEIQDHVRDEAKDEQPPTAVLPVQTVSAPVPAAVPKPAQEPPALPGSAVNPNESDVESDANKRVAPETTRDEQSTPDEP
jgi:hypothetical protein